METAKESNVALFRKLGEWDVPKADRISGPCSPKTEKLGASLFGVLRKAVVLPVFIGPSYALAHGGRKSLGHLAVAQTSTLSVLA
jgi:hypothetical protein